MTKSDDVQLDGVRDRLLRQRNELIVRAGRVEGDLRHSSDPLVADAPDQAAQIQNDDVLRKIDDAAAAEMAAIDLALERLKHGRYGICSVCHVPIDPQRLLAVPYAVTCVPCSQARNSPR
jgi:DnaK suppressor protein